MPPEYWEFVERANGCEVFRLMRYSGGGTYYEHCRITIPTGLIDMIRAESTVQVRGDES